MFFAKTCIVPKVLITNKQIITIDDSRYYQTNRCFTLLANLSIHISQPNPISCYSIHSKWMGTFWIVFFASLFWTSDIKYLKTKLTNKFRQNFAQRIQIKTEKRRKRECVKKNNNIWAEYLISIPIKIDCLESSNHFRIILLIVFFFLVGNIRENKNRTLGRDGVEAIHMNCCCGENCMLIVNCNVNFPFSSSVFIKNHQLAMTIRL